MTFIPSDQVGELILDRLGIHSPLTKSIKIDIPATGPVVVTLEIHAVNPNHQTDDMSNITSFSDEYSEYTVHGVTENTITYEIDTIDRVELLRVLGLPVGDCHHITVNFNLDAAVNADVNLLLHESQVRGFIRLLPDGCTDQQAVRLVP